MNIICKNCNHHFKGNFCSNCGQSADTHRLNVHFLWNDVKKGMLHIDEGILYSLLQLFTRPGHSIREFIEGKRKNHFKPLSLVIVWSTTYVLIHHLFHTNLINDIHSDTLDMEKTNGWITKHFAFITLTSIPMYTLGTFIAYRKEAYNFIEHLVLNAYLAAQRLAVHILLFPLIYFLRGTPNENIITPVILIVDMCLAIWCYTQFFNKLPRQKAFSLAVLSYFITLTFMIIIVSIITGIMEWA